MHKALQGWYITWCRTLAIESGRHMPYMDTKFYVFKFFLLSNVTGMFSTFNRVESVGPWEMMKAVAQEISDDWGEKLGVPCFFLISCCCCFLSICFKVSGTSWYVGIVSGNFPRSIYELWTFWELRLFFRSFLPRWWEMVSINHSEVATCGSSVLSVKCTSSLRPNHIPKTMVPRNGCLIYLGIFWDWPYFGLFLEL